MIARLRKRSRADPEDCARKLDIPEAVEKVLQKAMQRNPDDRFQTAVEFAEAFAVAAGVCASGKRSVGQAVRPLGRQGGALFMSRTSVAAIALIACSRALPAQWGYWPGDYCWPSDASHSAESAYYSACARARATQTLAGTWQVPRCPGGNACRPVLLEEARFFGGDSISLARALVRCTTARRLRRAGHTQAKRTSRRLSGDARHGFATSRHRPRFATAWSCDYQPIRDGTRHRDSDRWPAPNGTGRDHSIRAYRACWCRCRGDATCGPHERHDHDRRRRGCHPRRRDSCSRTCR